MTPSRDPGADPWPLPAAVLVAVVVLGPMLGRGSPLRYDLVSVPRPVLTLDTLGLGDRLPRAVPLDGAGWLLGAVLPGWGSQVLGLAALVLAGWGAARLVGGPLPGRLLAVLVAQWNPFVLEQLAIGHVPHLLAYGCLPWAGIAGYRLACGAPAATRAATSAARPAATPAAAPGVANACRLAAVMALGSLTPGGGLLCVGAALAGLAAGARGPAGAQAGRPARSRLGAGASIAVVAQVPWLVAALAHPSLGTGQSAQAARAAVADFAVRAETPAGRFVDTLGLGGMWNASALPASRGTWLALASTVLLLALAAAGAVGLAAVRRQGWGRVLAAGLVPMLAGYLVALLPVLPGGEAALARLVQVLPAAGLLRDGHRWLGWPAIGIAVLCGYGTNRVGAALADRNDPGSSVGAAGGGATGAAGSVRVASAVLLAALVIATMPDLAWGVSGRLAARHYPADWSRARQALRAADDRSALLVLPWQPFRRFAWAGEATVLDPAPRYLPRPAVVSDALTVNGRTLAQEGPSARRIRSALSDDRLTDAELRAAGVGWVLVERGTPGRLPELPETDPVLDGPDLQLSRLPGPLPQAARPGGGRMTAVGAAHLLPIVVLLVLAGCRTMLAAGRRQRVTNLLRR